MANFSTEERVASNLSTAELVKEITTQVGQLAKKQIELAKAELKTDLKTEAVAVGGLGVAALAALAGVNLLLVTVVFALAEVMPGWGAGLIVSGAVFLFAALAAAFGWNKRVKKPLARTRETIEEDVRIVKERTA
jgi:hypothetical protein